MIRAARLGRPRPGRTASLAVLAVAAPVIAWIVAAGLHPGGLYNDFHSYWYGARVLAAGGSPYDLPALNALAAREGDTFLLGTGYSYPPPFAFAMVPLGALPFGAAIVVFNAISLAVFGIAVAAWLVRLHPLASPGRLRLAAFLAGAFPPVVGSVLNGQANLLVTGALAFGAYGVLRPGTRSLVGGLAIGLAAIVKLVPGVLMLPLWLAGRRAMVAGILAGAGLPLAIAVVVRPDVALDSGSLGVLFNPDPFITNQSVNGFVSRLVLSSDRMTAPAPGAFDPLPVVLVLTLGLAAATVAALWRSHDPLRDPASAACAVAFVLVGATAGAPKTSFWNESLVLVGVGLLLAVAAPRLDGIELTSLERRILVGWLASSFVQPFVWLVGPRQGGPAAAVVAGLASIALYGSLALWWLLGRRLLRASPPASARLPPPA